MLRYKDFETEIKKMQDKAKDGKLTLGDVVKGIELIGKFARDIRSNQVRLMEKQGVNLRTGKPTEDANKSESETKKDKE